MPLHLRAQRSERPEARHLAAHQLEEAALVAALDLLLVEERELLLVELPEPVVPGDVVEAILLAPGGSRCAGCRRPRRRTRCPSRSRACRRAPPPNDGS